MSQRYSTVHSPQRQPKRKRHISTEWITFAIASTIVAILIGLVLYSWATESHEPPILSIEQSAEVRANQGQFYVPFVVTNTGGETAESVQVVGSLRIGAQVETGEQQIDFLSANEKVNGAFVFRRPPDQGELSLRVASYKLP